MAKAQNRTHFHPRTHISLDAHMDAATILNLTDEIMHGSSKTSQNSRPTLSLYAHMQRRIVRSSQRALRECVACSERCSNLNMRVVGWRTLSGDVIADPVMIAKSSDE